MLALDNELVFLAHFPRAEELLVVLAVKQRRLVTIQSGRAADQGKPLRVLEAEVERELALGGGDHVRVGQAHLQLQVVLCFVAKTIPGMLTPCPLSGVFYWLLWIL